MFDRSKAFSIFFTDERCLLERQITRREVTDDLALDVLLASDGVGDYLVWLKAGEESYYACDASAEAELYAFEPVTVPLEGEEQPDKTSPDARTI